MSKKVTSFTPTAEKPVQKARVSVREKDSERERQSDRERERERFTHCYFPWITASAK